MAIKTFTSGEVLTAADTNTYLANAGLVFVKSQTVGNAVASVTVTDAFSATYDYYKIIYTDGVGSAENGISMTLGATVTGYYYGIVIGRYDNVGSLSGGGANAAAWASVGFTDTTGNLFEVEITQPFSTKKTGIKGWHWDPRTGGGTGFGFSGGHLENSTSYTAFTLTVTGGGTITGGTIIVYGFRKG
jgi:hypothetical protein